MNGFYELECVDGFGFGTYYYFYNPREIRSLKTVLNRGCAPDAMRIVVDDREEMPIKIRSINIFEYIYKKYFKKAGAFRMGYRVDWEKEINKILKDS